MSIIDIMIADDDKRLCTFITQHLKASEQYSTLQVHDGFDALEKLALHQPKILILDLSMPKITGMEVLAEIQDWYEGSVIILSATDEEREKVKALDLGADDYLTKPFGVEELLARIRTLLRRQSYIDNTFDPKVTSIQFGDITIDFVTRVVTKNKREISLTKTEYGLLKILALNKNKIMSHKELLQKVWGSEYSGESEYLRTFIKQLRKKIEVDPSRPTYLITKPGMGYRLASN